MTYEYAEYLKLLLLCGYKDELQSYVDDALVKQDPLSEVVLALAAAGDSDKKLLSALNEYLQTNDEELDYDKTVFDFVMAFLKRKYTEDSMSMEEITDLMMRIAVHTDRYYDQPWNTMYLMGDYFYESEIGYIGKEQYSHMFDEFINDKVCLRLSEPIQSKESIFKRLIKKITGRH